MAITNRRLVGLPTTSHTQLLFSNLSSMRTSRSHKSRRVIDRALSLDTAISQNDQIGSQVTLLKQVRFAEFPEVIGQSPPIPEGSEATSWYTVSHPYETGCHCLFCHYLRSVLVISPVPPLVEWYTVHPRRRETHAESTEKGWFRPFSAGWEWTLPKRTGKFTKK